MERFSSSESSQVVDLTSGARERTVPTHVPDSDPGEESSHRTKRRRLDRLPSSFSQEQYENIESVDLTEVAGPASLEEKLEEALVKNREENEKPSSADQENKGEEKKKPSILTEYKCPVCMDTPVDATTTACGKFLLYTLSNVLYSF